MLRPVPAVAALALLAGPAGAGPAGAAPSGGRVVRVERRGARGLGVPRNCAFSGGTSLTIGQCYGHEVEAGELVTIASTTGVVAHLRVTKATPDTLCSGTALIWIVEGELEGAATRVAPDAILGGVIDGGLDPRRARVAVLDASPSGRSTDADFSGYDTDGDGAVDLMFDHYTCDTEGQPSGSTAAQCFEVWAAGDRMHAPHRLRLDVVPQC